MSLGGISLLFRSYGGAMFKQPFFWLMLSSALVLTMVTRNLLQDRNELYSHSEDFPEILNLVDRAYVDPVAMGKLMPGVFQGALDAVDPNASYLAPGNEPLAYWQEVYRKWGLVLVRENSMIRIAAVAPASSAEQADIFPGSYLRRIGASSTRKMNLYQARRDLAKWTTTLKLSLFDPVLNKEVEKELEPGTCECESFLVKELEGNIVYVRFPHELSNQTDKLTNQIEALMGPDTKLLLDLRNNALGDETYLSQLASLFLDRGEVITWRFAKDAPVAMLNPQPGIFSQKNLFILVDEGTSWAAEAFAAVAQDRKQALILGTATKGFPMGYDFLSLKNGGYLQFSQRSTAFGENRTLTMQGITPDWEGPKIKEREGDPLLEGALTYLRSGKALQRKAS